MTKSILLLMTSALFVATMANANDDALIEEAQQLVKTFAGQLKPKLKNAMQNGGPAHAISVCANAAPEIARTLSATSGWEIKRVSLKPRNIHSATADKFEQQALMQFEQWQNAGKNVGEMFFARRQNQQFRFLKPQLTEGLCLSCHGENLSTEVQTALKKFAPGDTAVGYQLGEIRGAFSLSKTLGSLEK